MRSGVFVRVGDVVNALFNKRDVLKGKVPQPSRWTAWMRAATMAIATAGAMAASASFAAITTVSVLIDADNNASTGCSVSTANGPFAGVERVLNTTVIADASGYRIQSITLQSCNGAAIGPATIISSTPTPLVRGSGANGTTAVETYIPGIFLPANGQKMRVAVTSVGSDGLVGSDALTLTSAGNAILVDGPPLVVVPTLAKLSLALTALLLALSVWFARRRGWNGMQLVIVAAFAVSMSSQLIAAVSLDGLKISWAGISPVATDPAGDAPKGSDFTNFFSAVDSGNILFRVEVDLNSPPVANAQSVTAVVGQSLAIALTGSDFEGSPLTFAIVTPPTQGVLSGTAPNLTYTPNASAGVSDSFTFRANDGSADSAPATVSIDIKRPPTITSINNATFIPGQANSFTFTATGVPSSNFALTACNAALPVTIAITNNGNNTGTLAGNPTVAQGGTYICTLTASNGFGSDATQQFTLNLGLPPTFTSANSTTFATGAAGTFSVTTTATPATTSITQTGTLPSGVAFAYASGLSATLAGTPAAGTGGTYPITLTAGNGIPPNSTQSFTLTVNQAPAVTSANSLTCIVGVACSLPITASGFPLPTIAIGGAALPGGIAYAAGTPGNGTLSGTPTAGGVGTYALTFTASSSTTPNAVQNFTLNVNKAATTTALASSLNPSIAGQPVTFTATVTPQGTGVPTGTVTFNDGATAVCSNVAVNGSGVATCTTSALTVAASPHSMTAIYAGDTSFFTSTSAAVNQVVTKANATTALASSVNPSNFGQSVTFTATVTAVAPASGTPSGTVTFNDGAAALCSNVAVSGAGVATCTTSALSTAASPHSVTAIYGGDASFNASPASAVLSQVVNKAATSTVLTSGTNPSVFGQSVTFTATVSVAAPGAGTPTGTVNFTDGAATVCANAAVSGAGVATCTTSTLTTGSHSVTASYGGDASFSASASSVLTQVISKASSTTALTSGTNPSASGQSVTFTATIAPAAPGVGTLTGTVAFNDGATVVCAAATVSAGAATCTTSALSATGSPHSITATYSGDSNFSGSASAVLSQVVNKANSASTVTSSKTPTVAGEGVTFTAAVAAVAPGTGVPTGTVTFNDGATPICANVALVAGGATCTTTALSVTSHTITVTYSGDAALNASTSPAITQVVGLAGTTTAVTTSGSPSTAGSSVTFTATVSPVAPATGTPTGTVTFNDGVTAICNSVALVSGIATCSTTALTVGSHGITAVYSGSVGFATSTSANLTQAVNPGPATHFAVSAPASAVSGTAFNVTVTALDALNNIATGYRGTAHFTSSDGAATLPADYTFTAGDNGVHSFTGGATLRTAGSRTITATDTVTASITGVSGAINVGAAGATNFVISGTPTTTTAGVALSYTVTARDASNNVATGYVGTVNFTSTDGAATLPINYTFTGGDAGVHAFASGATLRTAGVHTIAATDTVTASITGTSASITVNAAATSTYAISAPGTAVSGTPISVTVTAQDAFGNTTTSYGGTVHFTSSDPAATLPADSPLTAGVGTFAATLKTAGSRTISATDTVTPAINKTSGAINVSAGAAAKLAFAQQPTNTTSAAAITPAITVQIQDAAGNLVNSAANVTLAIGTNPGGGILSGTTTAAASSGVATFSGLSIDKLGVGYTLVASSGALTSAASASFNIAAGIAAKLAFIQQPTNATSGAAIAPAMTVRIQDAAGNLVNSTANVTLTIGTNPGSGTLSGTATVAAVGGVATFNNLNIDKAGTGYTLVASSGALTSATSTSFNITAGAAAKLAFVQQPSNTTSGAAIAPAMTVQVQDAAGNLVNSAASVTLAIGTNPGGGTLSGTLTAAAAGGVAAFNNLSIDKAATGYRLTATSGALTPANSSLFNIVPGPATNLSVVAPANATSGTAFNFTVTVRDAFNNTATGYSGTVHYTSSDGVATLPANSTLTSGVGTFFATLQTVGTQTITATDTVTGTINGTSTSILVAAALTITGNPANQSVNAGQTATFTASATGTPSPTVQWQLSTDGGGTFNNVAGATSTTLSFTTTAGQNGNQFRAVFTSGANTANTSAATLTVIAPNQAPSATGFTGLPAQAGITITYPAGKLGGTDPEGGAVTVATTPDTLCASCALTLRADGGFDFTATPAMAGTTQSFTYHVTDNGSPPPVLSSPAVTVSFTVAGPAIYFVKSAAAGTGNCTLGNECTLSTALTNIGASTNSHIFLGDANTHSTASVTHNSGGRIIGQGVAGASFDAVFGIAAPAQGTLATRPLINLTKPTVNSTITAHNTSHVRGLIIKPAAGANKGLVASGKTGLVLSELAIDMTANGATGNALEFVSTSGDYTGGGLVITATSGKGITATGGGIVTVQGTGNKVTTTTGTALEVSGSTIGASHMTFESINSGTAASGPTNGILLSSTGTSGRLIVTGSGAAGTGGTVQKSAGAGVSLTSTNGPSLSWMTISGSTGSGINGTSVTGSMLLDRLTVAGNSTLASTNCTPISICQAGIFLYNLTGSGHTISNSTIFGSAENSVHVENDGASTLGGLTLTGNTIRDNQGLGGLGNGLHIKANGTAGVTVSATNNVFAANLGSAIQADAGGTTNAINLTATNNAMHSAGVTSTQGGTGIGMSVNANSTPTLTFNITGNTIGKNGATNAPLASTGITISENTTAHSTVTGNITNNTIFGAGAAAVGGGIRVFPAGVTGSLWKVRVDGNTLSNIGAGYGIFVGSGEQAGTGDSDVQAGVINNNVSVLSTAFDAIRVQSRVNSTMCARITGNTGVQTASGNCANNLAGTGFCGIQVRQANASTFSLEGGGSNAQILTNNPGTALAAIAFAGTITTVAANSCNQIP